MHTPIVRNLYHRYLCLCQSKYDFCPNYIIKSLLCLHCLGRVVDGDTKYPLTLQEELINFSKALLFPVELSEPPSYFPLGR